MENDPEVEIVHFKGDDIMESAATVVVEEGDDILYQSVEENVFVLETSPSKPSLDYAPLSNTGVSEKGRKMPKVVLKNISSALTKRECDLINDCVESLADQDCTEPLKLRTRSNSLCAAEWWKVSEVMVKLMQQHLSENGVEVIDHTHIEQARNQMRETYRWAGYVVGKDFQHSDFIKTVSQDACYDVMRKRNNWGKSNAKKATLHKRTNAQNSHSTSKKRRTADSFGVLMCHESNGSIDQAKWISYKSFCKELLMLPIGHQLSQQQIEKANTFWDCLMSTLKDVKPAEFQDLQLSGKLAMLKHMRLFLAFVQRITQREDTVIHKFQDNCDTYLACLGNILKSFPPIDKHEIRGLDIKNSPYISLVKIISAQLGRKPSFILDQDDLTEEMLKEAGPICLIRSGSFYDLCINGVTVVPHLQEIQAVFCFASSEDVFCLSQGKLSDSVEVIDFMRKFFLNVPDFHMKRPKVSLLGQGFSCFAEIHRAKIGGYTKSNKFASIEKAVEAIQDL